MFKLILIISFSAGGGATLELDNKFNTEKECVKEGHRLAQHANFQSKQDGKRSVIYLCISD